MERQFVDLDLRLENFPPFIFLGGVHGVGKTTICNNAFIPQGYHCVTASVLIAAQGLLHFENKQVTCVSKNQEILIYQLSLQKKRHDRLLLDGHFCLINTQNKVEPIDIDVFKLMAPSLLIFVKGDTKKIAERLKKRDNKGWDIDFIDLFQQAEEKHAIKLSNDLAIPLKIYLND